MDHPNVQALYRCCLAVSQAGGRSGNAGQGQAPKGDLAEVLIRSDFPESWLFKDNLVDLGDSESQLYPIPLPDSITTWIIQAVGVSPLHGMCVADNKEIVVRRDVFLDVAIPYSVMRHEQVAIQATVYNYDKDGRETEVTLKMVGVAGLCSNARPGEFIIKEGVIAAGQAKSFSFIVIPLDIQDYIVTIYMISTYGNDAVSKTLHVVPEGTRQVQPLSIVLDPAGFGQQIPQNENNEVVDHGLLNNLEHMHLNDQGNQNQIDTVKLSMPDDAIPNTAQCEVNLIGSLLGPVASAVIEGLNSGAFLNMPRGCGEQTMIYTAPNVYIYKYLKVIGEDTPDIEKKAITNIEAGYSREVNHYRNPDGAFKTFGHTPGNSWLTSFVLRVFCKAKEFINVDQKVICEGMTWLANIQKPDGSFGFTTRTYHTTHFMGGVDEPITLTAFVLITLSECDCATLDTTETVSKATMFLEGKLAEIGQDPHSLAIVTYALALVNSARANDFNTQLKTHAHDNAALGTKYFGTQGSGALTVETTAYTLLAQITLGEISYSFPIVQWLMIQRDQVGNWYSTQDTMVALQALSEYAQRAHTGDIDLTCDITSSVDAQFQPAWQVLPENALVLQATQAPVEGDLVFETHGIGIATLSVNLHYYKASGNDNQCPFEVTITPTDMKADPAKPGAPVDEKPKKKLKLQVCAKYTGTGNTNMAIIDVGLLSGFTPIAKSLKKVTEDAPLIQFYEVSDRSVIFYADNIPSGDGVQPLCVTFEAQQDFEVGNVQPVAVKVYDYYLPERKCIKFYRPDGNSPVLDTICDEQGQACECAAASCLNMDPELQLQVPKLKDLACQTVQHFAYKTSFVAKHLKDTFETYVMRVTPLKTGLDQHVQLGQQRQFWKSVNCEHPKIEDGNDYLIVGKSGIPIKNANGDITEYRHFVDSGFTVIHWPNADQLRQPERDCKNECEANNANNQCKVACRRLHRPAENTRKEYFQKVEEEFIRGCPL
ncbi:complement C3-like [Amphiura filiformis]|uniref:complement C3-like n=1 Tax=Amphiura filiformis TaxID=82378 RepID=UPI003B211B5B